MYSANIQQGRGIKQSGRPKLIQLISASLFFTYNSAVSMGIWMNSYDGKLGGYAWTQLHRLSLIKTDVVTDATKCPIFQQQKLMSSSIWHHPSRRTISYLIASWLHKITFTMKEAAGFFDRKREIISGIDLHFLPTRPQVYIVFPPFMWHPTYIVLD